MFWHTFGKYLNSIGKWNNTFHENNYEFLLFLHKETGWLHRTEKNVSREQHLLWYLHKFTCRGPSTSVDNNFRSSNGLIKSPTVAKSSKEHSREAEERVAGANWLHQTRNLSCWKREIADPQNSKFDLLERVMQRKKTVVKLNLVNKFNAQKCLASMHKEVINVIVEQTSFSRKTNFLSRRRQRCKRFTKARSMSKRRLCKFVKQPQSYPVSIWLLALCVKNASRYHFFFAIKHVFGNGIRRYRCNLLKVRGIFLDSVAMRCKVQWLLRSSH